VPIYSIPYYLSSDPGFMAYPDFKDIKYPKPGYPNPVVDLYIHTVGSEPWKVTYPEPLDKRGLFDDLFGLEGRDGDETDGWGNKKLITYVEWMGDDKLMVSETNRVSDHFRAILVDVNEQAGKIVRDEKLNEGWFEIVCFPQDRLTIVSSHDVYSQGYRKGKNGRWIY
jgi:dipeptidyl aminopeptidase B